MGRDTALSIVCQKSNRNQSIAQTKTLLNQAKSTKSLMNRSINQSISQSVNQYESSARFFANIVHCPSSFCHIRHPVASTESLLPQQISIGRYRSTLKQTSIIREEREREREKERERGRERYRERERGKEGKGKPV